MKSLSYILVIICLFCTLEVQAQKHGKPGRRLFISASTAAGITGRKLLDIDENDFYYNPKNSEFEFNRSPFYVPAELGLNLVVSRNLVFKMQAGMQKAYAQVRVSGPQSWLAYGQNYVNELYPYLVRDLTIGFQVNNSFYWSRKYLRWGRNSNYIAPVSRSYFEFEYTHSFYTQISEYVNTNPAIQFGTLTLGVYKNLFFQNFKSFFGFAGVRAGIPVYFQKTQSAWIQQNVEGVIDQADSWDNLRLQNILVKSFQVRVGVKYLLPF